MTLTDRTVGSPKLGTYTLIFLRREVESREVEQLAEGHTANY